MIRQVGAPAFQSRDVGLEVCAVELSDDGSRAAGRAKLEHELRRRDELVNERRGRGGEYRGIVSRTPPRFFDRRTIRPPQADGGPIVGIPIQDCTGDHQGLKLPVVATQVERRPDVDDRASDHIEGVQFQRYRRLIRSFGGHREHPGSPLSQRRPGAGLLTLDSYRHDEQKQNEREFRLHERGIVTASPGGCEAGHHGQARLALPAHLCLTTWLRRRKKGKVATPYAFVRLRSIRRSGTNQMSATSTYSASAIHTLTKASRIAEA